MRTLFIIIAQAALAASSSALAGTSLTTIPKGQSFALGGDQVSKLHVTGKNVGPVAVKIFSKQAGKRVERGLVQPRGEIVADFAVGETAIIENTSSINNARIYVQFNASVNSLSMRYQPARK